MKNRNKLVKILKKEITADAMNYKSLRPIILKIHKDSGLPIDSISDFFTGRKGLDSATDFELFKIAKQYEDRISLSIYYVDREIKEYSKQKFVKKGIKFPIRLKMIQIADDQWIGSVSAKQLMEWRDAQIIYYNENTQRTMNHIINGEEEHYEISLNKSAVEKIMESYDNESFIPNTITLNLLDAEDSQAEYYYDNKTMELVINSLEHFDILDGYHRYVAMSKKYNLGSDFDYPMELRIVSFTEDKAKQFIYQEDQKTKMKKLDSESMNQNNIANRVAQRLNSDGSFNLYGEIGLNGKIINKAEFAAAIEGVYNTKAIKKKDEHTETIRISSEIKDGINEFTRKSPEYLTNQWESNIMYAILLTIQANKCNKRNVNHLVKYAKAFSSMQKGKMTNKSISELRKELK